MDAGVSAPVAAIWARVLPGVDRVGRDDWPRLCLMFGGTCI